MKFEIPAEYLWFIESFMSNVTQLFAPHNERLAELRRWHMDQAIAKDPSVCVLNVAVTASGNINTSAVGIEPEHAAAMLNELKAAVVRLERYVGERAPELLEQVTVPYEGNVVKLLAEATKILQ